MILSINRPLTQVIFTQKQFFFIFLELVSSTVLTIFLLFHCRLQTKSKERREIFQLLLTTSLTRMNVDVQQASQHAEQVAKERKRRKNSSALWNASGECFTQWICFVFTPSDSHRKQCPPYQCRVEKSKRNLIHSIDFVGVIKAFISSNYLFYHSPEEFTWNLDDFNCKSASGALIFFNRKINEVLLIADSEDTL